MRCQRYAARETSTTDAKSKQDKPERNYTYASESDSAQVLVWWRMSWTLQGLVAQKKWGTTTRRLMALTLASVANNDGSGIYASVKTMARDSEISESTARRTLQEFEAQGLLRKVGERPCLNGFTNVYHLDADVIARMEDLNPEKPAKFDRGVTVTGVSPRHGVHCEPGPRRHQTPVTVTDNPIQDPISESLPVGRAKKSAQPRTYSDAFLAAWRLWPKSVRQSAKRLSWDRWCEQRGAFDEAQMLAAVQVYLASPQATKRDNDGRAFGYVAAFERWLPKNLETWIEIVADPSIIAEPDLFRGESNGTGNHTSSFNGGRNHNGRQRTPTLELIAQAVSASKVGY